MHNKEDFYERWEQFCECLLVRGDATKVLFQKLNSEQSAWEIFFTYFSLLDPFVPITRHCFQAEVLSGTSDGEGKRVPSCFMVVSDGRNELLQRLEHNVLANFPQVHLTLQNCGRNVVNPNIISNIIFFILTGKYI